MTGRHGWVDKILCEAVDLTGKSNFTMTKATGRFPDQLATPFLVNGKIDADNHNSWPFLRRLFVIISLDLLLSRRHISPPHGPLSGLTPW